MIYLSTHSQCYQALHKNSSGWIAESVSDTEADDDFEKVEQNRKPVRCWSVWILIGFCLIWFYMI